MRCSARPDRAAAFAAPGSADRSRAAGRRGIEHFERAVDRRGARKVEPGGQLGRDHRTPRNVCPEGGHVVIHRLENPPVEELAADVRRLVRGDPGARVSGGTP